MFKTLFVPVNFHEYLLSIISISKKDPIKKRPYSGLDCLLKKPLISSIEIPISRAYKINAAHSLSSTFSVELMVLNIMKPPKIVNILGSSAILV